MAIVETGELLLASVAAGTDEQRAQIVELLTKLRQDLEDGGARRIPPARRSPAGRRGRVGVRRPAGPSGSPTGSSVADRGGADRRPGAVATPSAPTTGGQARTQTSVRTTARTATPSCCETDREPGSVAPRLQWVTLPEAVSGCRGPVKADEPAVGILDDGVARPQHVERRLVPAAAGPAVTAA